jgi:hypothetical protein
VSRRRHVFRDPTARAILPEDALNRLVAVLVDNFSARERGIFLRRFGVQDRRPQTFDEIAEQYGVTRRRVSQVLERMTEKLNTALEAEGLVAEDLLPVVRELRQRIVSSIGRESATVNPLPSLVYCPIHGSWADPESSPGYLLPACGYCPCVVPPEHRPGRPRKYCSDACKQAAYRDRTSRTLTPPGCRD